MKQQANNDESPDSFMCASSHAAPRGAVRGAVNDNGPFNVNDLQEAVDELVAMPGSDHRSGESSVDVSMDGDWCVVEGTVDSQMTRAEIFSLVPDKDGKRFIVDRLQVTYE